MLASIPNVMHWEVVYDLLRGRWDYQHAGILDRTHLRFFTKKTIIELMEQADLSVEMLKGRLLPPLGNRKEMGQIFIHHLRQVPGVTAEQTDFETYQWLVVAKKSE